MPSAKSDLLDSIHGVFLARGYDGATLTHLSRATSLSKAALYHHFPAGKPEMARSLVHQAISRLQTQAFGPLTHSAPPQALTAFIDGFSSYVEHGESDCILTIFGRYQTAHEDIDELKEQITQQFIDWHAVLTTVFQSLGYKTKKADRAAHALVANLYGTLLNAKMHHNPNLFVRGVKRMRKDMLTACKSDDALRTHNN